MFFGSHFCASFSQPDWSSHGNHSTSEHPNGQGSCVGNFSPCDVGQLELCQPMDWFIFFFRDIMDLPRIFSGTELIFLMWAISTYIKIIQNPQKKIRNPTRPQKIQQVILSLTSQPSNVAPVVSEPWGEGPQRIRQSEAARPKDPTFEWGFMVFSGEKQMNNEYISWTMNSSWTMLMMMMMMIMIIYYYHYYYYCYYHYYYYYYVWLVNTDEHWWCFWIMNHNEQFTQHDRQYYGGAIYDIVLFIIYNDVIDLHIVIRLWGWAMGFMIRTS